MTAAGTGPEETGVELDPNREAQIRQLHEELGPVRTLAAVGARVAIGDLLAEIGRLRRVAEASDLCTCYPNPFDHEDYCPRRQA